MPLYAKDACCRSVLSHHVRFGSRPESKHDSIKPNSAASQGVRRTNRDTEAEQEACLTRPPEGCVRTVTSQAKRTRSVSLKVTPQGTYSAITATVTAQRQRRARPNGRESRQDGGGAARRLHNQARMERFKWMTFCPVPTQPCGDSVADCRPVCRRPMGVGESGTGRTLPGWRRASHPAACRPGMGNEECVLKRDR